MSLLVLVPTEAELAGLASAIPADVACALCGIGLPAAALGAARALARWSVEHCLLVGIAGSRDPLAAPLGTVVCGTSVFNEAVGAGQGQAFRPLGDLGLSGMTLPPDELPLEPWGRPAPGWPWVRGAIGTVAAASATSAESVVRRRLRPTVLVEEMEGHAVALACQEAGVPLSILRGVSNVAGERERHFWDVEGALAGLSAVLAGSLPGALAR